MSKILSAPNPRLLRNSSGWCEREAQAGRLALQVAGFPFTKLLFILLSTHLAVFHFELYQMVHHPGDLVGGGDLGLSRTETGLQAAIEGPKGAVAAGHRGGCLEEGLAGPVVALAGGRTDDFAAGDLIVGAQFEPRSKVFDRGEAGHIRPDLGDDLLGQVEAEAVHRGEVNAGDAAQVAADLDR